jgi:hypothetical protein
MPRYESQSFPDEKAGQEFIKEKKLRLRASFLFPPDEKDLQPNECLLISTPKEKPKEWIVRYRVFEK